MDHVIPFSKGGDDSSSNLRPLCGRCNMSRGVKRTPDDASTRYPVALHCVLCAPDEEAEHTGFCFTCGEEGMVSETQIDRCPDPSECDCARTPRGKRILKQMQADRTALMPEPLRAHVAGRKKQNRRKKRGRR